MFVTSFLLYLGIGFLACTPAEDFSKESDNQFQEAFLRIVNSYRTAGCKCGSTNMPPVAPLKWNEKLAKAAERHTRDMATNYHFDHTGTDGSSSADRIEQAGYKWRAVGENIAYGYADMEAVISGWIKSKGHCKNIMSPNYTEMGAAQSGTYWAQTFGRPE